jgi:hypothetical protein
MRIPKYTAGMFKKKMPRFGASAIKKPRLPTPPKPRVKKYEEGGEVEEVVVSPEAYRKQESKDLVMRYLAASKRAAAKKAEQKKDPDKERVERMRKEFDALMEDRKRREREAESLYMQEMKRGIRTARSGGKMDSCCRGDGIAKKGKTRGKFV